MVLFGGHAWFYSGGMRGFIRGVCGFIQGGMHGFIRGVCVVLFGGACVVLFGGGMHGFFIFFRYNEIRSMSGRYASYWNAFLFTLNRHISLKLREIIVEGSKRKKEAFL